MANPTPQQTPAPTNLYQACTTCARPRVLCVRVRRRRGWSPMDQGHANLTVHEGGSFTSYGKWSGSGPGGAVRRDHEGDNFQRDDRFNPRDVRCREMNAEQERRLEQALSRREEYGLARNNCAQWAGSTWNNVMGENLGYGTGAFTPGDLGNSINAAGPGVTP